MEYGEIRNYWISKPPMRRSTTIARTASDGVVSKPPMRRSTQCKLVASTNKISKPPMRRSTIDDLRGDGDADF